MKKLIVLAMILFMCACKTGFESDKYAKAKSHIPEVREFLIAELEIEDASAVTFVNTTNPEMREVNSILYYWFKDSTGKAVYTVEAQPGKDFHIFTAKKN